MTKLNEGGAIDLASQAMPPERKVATTALRPGLGGALSGLIQGGRETASMGRVAFWLIFILCAYFWLARPIEAFPPGLQDAFFYILAYNLGGKAVKQFSHRVTEKED